MNYNNGVPLNSGWMTSVDHCTWNDDLTCNGDGYLIKLCPEYESLLGGTIPSEIHILTSLETLDLNNNFLTGTVPSEIGALSDLQAIYLQDNGLIGSIPTEFGGLTNLKVISR